MDSLGFNLTVEDSIQDQVDINWKRGYIIANELYVSFVTKTSGISIARMQKVVGLSSGHEATKNEWEYAIELR